MEQREPIVDSAHLEQVNADTAAAIDEQYPPTATDASGHHAGQSWEHDGFSITARTQQGTEDPSLLYDAVESEASQVTHSARRQFRYRQTFTSLDGAQQAIDAANAFTTEMLPGTQIIGRIISNGQDDAEMAQNGWERVTRGA